MAAVAALAVACASRGQRAGPPPCAPFERPRTLDAEAIAALAGDYSLTLVATSGERLRIQRARAFERGARLGTGTRCPRTRAGHGQRGNGGRVKAS